MERKVLRRYSTEKSTYMNYSDGTWERQIIEETKIHSLEHVVYMTEEDLKNLLEESKKRNIKSDKELIALSNEFESSNPEEKGGILFIIYYQDGKRRLRSSGTVTDIKYFQDKQDDLDNDSKINLSL